MCVLSQKRITNSTSKGCSFPNSDYVLVRLLLVLYQFWVSSPNQHAFGKHRESLWNSRDEDRHKVEMTVFNTTTLSSVSGAVGTVKITAKRPSQLSELTG